MNVVPCFDDSHLAVELDLRRRLDEISLKRQDLGISPFR